MNKRILWLLLATLPMAGYATKDVWAGHPKSAALPTWISGEFAASAERYAGRTVLVDSSMIRFSRSEAGADVLPIEWIEEVKDARRHIRILDLHVRDGSQTSTMRLIASSEDSSFRLQTMPDVAWRRRSDRDARAQRMAARERGVDAGAMRVRAPIGSSGADRESASAALEPAGSDTVIGATRFADRDPTSRDELTQVVAACRRFGCRIGIRGLQESRFAEFSAYLRKLGADSVALTPEPSTKTTFAMLVIAPSHVAARR